MTTLPEKGTPEYDLFVAAIDVAIYPPVTGSANAYTANVPWDRIHDLRKALETFGIDWRKAHEEERARRRAYMLNRQASHCRNHLEFRSDCALRE